MAVDLRSYSKMDDQIAIKEAAIASLQSMETLVLTLNTQAASASASSSSSSQQQRQQQLDFDCRAIAENTVSKFKRFISALDRTGHARFRRGPVQSSPPTLGLPPPPLPPARPAPLPSMNLLQPQPQPQPQTLTFDFTKPNPAKMIAGGNSQSFSDDSFSISPPISGNSSFLSSITADGSVSNGKGSSLFGSLNLSNNNNGRPPLSSSSKSKCHSGASGSHTASGTPCHCSKKRKNRVRRAIRVPAISSKIADIPSDSFSWRKYGQKPIKGSPHPSPYDSRAYYKCSTVRGCPARKHVERAFDDQSMLIVTYEEEHLHGQEQIVAVDGTADSMVFES